MISPWPIECLSLASGFNVSKIEEGATSDECMFVIIIHNVLQTRLSQAPKFSMLHDR